MDNKDLRNKLDHILKELQGGNLTPQEAHEAMKPLNELISRATTNLYKNNNLAEK